MYCALKGHEHAVRSACSTLSGSVPGGASYPGCAEAATLGCGLQRLRRKGRKATDRQIDYELYGRTDAEIRIVEGEAGT